VEFRVFGEVGCGLEPERAAMSAKIPRGRPAFAETQRQEILRLLREAGPSGISRAELIFERRFTQCGARVDELKRQGYVIESEQREGERYVRYVLKGEPLELRPLSERPPKTRDWFAESAGRERAKETPNYGPLFDGAMPEPRR
jgi:hypothetical protein